MNKKIIYLYCLIIFVSSCMDEPTYNIFHPKRDIQEPSGLGLEQIDAFQIKLNWQIDMGDNSGFLDGFIGKRFSSITPVENILEIEFNESFIISLNENGLALKKCITS